MHVLWNCQDCGIHLHHPSLLTLLVIRLHDKDDITLVVLSILVSVPMADMSIITYRAMHLMHNLSSFLIMIPRLSVLVSMLISNGLGISSCEWWRGRWW